MRNRIIITVIIASHRPQMISGLLDALDKQNIDKKFFETIVVCDYRPDAFHNRYLNVKWVFLDEKSISAKRNLGVHYSQGEILAFTDDDCIPYPDWISEAVGYLNEHENCSAVEGFTTIEKNTSGIGMYRESKRLESPAMRTNNIFYRKDVFLNAGGFDNRFTVQREDADLAFSVLEMGGKIDYCNKIRVEHRFRHWEYWDLLKNCWNRRFDPLLYKKHKSLYRKHLKFPLGPSILIQLLFYLSYLGGSLCPLRKRWICLFHILFAGILGMRRSGIAHTLKLRFFAELISVLLAPIIISAALIYGLVSLESKEKKT